jgi:ABC-type dipeptide/oligopeptide/nickel transport system permease subunit
MATEPSAAPASRSIGKSRSGLTRAGGRRRPNLRILIGADILTFFVAIAVVAPLIAPYDPLLPDQTRSLAPPSAAHPLGHDEFGRDVLSRLIFGARVSIEVSMVSIALALGVGTLAGLLAGYFGGLVDWIVMRGADVVLSVPPVLLAIGVVAILGPSLPNLILTIVVLYAPRFARVAYASARAVRALDYVLAAVALGAGSTYVLRKAVLPAIVAPLIVQGSLALGAAMLLESGLSFIGLGAQPPTPSWGSMVSAARSIMERVPLLVLSPSIALAAAILSFNILGDGVRDALDPRMR